jgi:hypothetical protein
VEERVW